MEHSNLPKPLPDIIAPGLLILFIGYNPGLRSAELGHHYAGKSNRFWEILFRSGLTAEKLSYTRDRELLAHGFGSTNIVDRPSKGADELTREDYLVGRGQLLAQLEEYKPVIACYVGSGVYKAFTGIVKTDWGLQPERTLAGITDFVAPSTSGLNRMPMAEQVRIYKGLKELLNLIE